MDSGYERLMRKIWQHNNSVGNNLVIGENSDNISKSILSVCTACPQRSTQGRSATLPWHHTSLAKTRQAQMAYQLRLLLTSAPANKWQRIWHRAVNRAKLGEIGQKPRRWGIRRNTRHNTRRNTGRNRHDSRMVPQVRYSVREFRSITPILGRIRSTADLSATMRRSSQ